MAAWRRWRQRTRDVSAEDVDADDEPFGQVAGGGASRTGKFTDAQETALHHGGSPKPTA